MRLSLRTKIVLLVIFSLLVVETGAVSISYLTYSKTMDAHYKLLATSVAKTAITQLDVDHLMIYLTPAEGVSDEEYQALRGTASDEYYAMLAANKDAAYDEMLSRLFAVKESNDVKYLYLEHVYKDSDGWKVSYIMDADAKEPYALGDVVPVAADNFEYLDRGEELPVFITHNKTYGWLVTAAVRVYDSQGTFIGLLGVDIDMTDVMNDRYNFLISTSVFLTIEIIVLVLLVILLINRQVINPVKAISRATSNFVESQSKEGDSDITKLQVKNRDEIGTLVESVKTMEREIHNYINDLTAVTKEKERIGTELKVATTIQASMLPCIFPAFPERKEFDIFASMTPAKEVGGDFYDLYLVDDDHLVVTVADVSGKGVPAALFMVISKTLIKNHMQSGMTPAEAFTATNAQLCENNEAEMFVTAWMALITISTGHVVFVNAGHNPPLVRHNNGEYEYMPSQAGFVLAGMPGLRYRQKEMDLAKGDSLFIYTDGVTEATNASEELYGEPRLKEILNHNRFANPTELLPKVKADIDAFVGEAPQFDDITMLCVKLL